MSQQLNESLTQFRNHVMDDDHSQDSSWNVFLKVYLYWELFINVKNKRNQVVPLVQPVQPPEPPLEDVPS